jgi:hypothetical protein
MFKPALDANARIFLKARIISAESLNQFISNLWGGGFYQLSAIGHRRIEI